MKDLLTIEKSYKSSENKTESIIDLIDFLSENKNIKFCVERPNWIAYDQNLIWEDRDKKMFKSSSDESNIYDIDDIDHINFSLKRIFIKEIKGDVIHA